MSMKIFSVGNRLKKERNDIIYHVVIILITIFLSFQKISKAVEDLHQALINSTVLQNGNRFFQ